MLEGTEDAVNGEEDVASDNSNNINENILHSFAHCIYRGRLEAPPVRIISTTDRGNILVATRPISKGSVIYTERAAACCSCDGDDEAPKTVEGEKIESIRSTQPTSCHQCFRSLEPIPSSTDDCIWPHPHLWPSISSRVSKSTPVSSKKEQSDLPYAIDSFGRLHCKQCPAFFCSTNCYYNQSCSLDYPTTTTTTTCCMVDTATRSVRALYHSVQQQPQAAVLLAVRMFSSIILQRGRAGRAEEGEEDPIDMQSDTIFHGLCGVASETQALELGLQERVLGNHKDDSDDYDNQEFSVSYVFRLELIYQAVVNGLHITQQQQQTTFTLELFQRCAAQAARNGFGFRTQSPFDTYYAAVIRVCGRGSPAHEQLKTTIATFLQRKEGETDTVGNTAVKDTSSNREDAPTLLQRGMDEQIQQRFTPELCALFALTSRINHSCCNTNAQVQSCTFVDATMDLLATQDIPAQTEITIRYLPPNAYRRAIARQRQLQARYLFQCSCSLCTESS